MEEKIDFDFNLFITGLTRTEAEDLLLVITGYCDERNAQAGGGFTKARVVNDGEENAG